MSIATEPEVGGDNIPAWWSHDCDGKGVKVEVLTEANGWVEIPTIKVETWVNKHGVADVQRTAKVKFPIEWNGRNVADLIKGFRPGEDSGFSFAKVYFRRDGDFEGQGTNWDLTHFGFVGGSIGGNADSTSTASMWVYDIADLLGGVPAAFEFDSPTPEHVIGKVASELDDLLPIDVDANIQDPPSQPLLFDVDKRGQKLQNMSFQINRHTLIDVMDSLSERTNSNWEIVPGEDGVSITLNLGPTQKLFRQDVLEDDPTLGNLLEFNIFDTENVVEGVKLIDNRALHDVTPINTVVVHGKAADPVLNIPRLDIIGDRAVVSGNFPIVKVRAKELYERAGVELSPPVIESEDLSIEEAKATASKVLMDEISQSAEGEIEIYGEPEMNPFDYIDAMPTCNERLETLDLPPLRYQIEEVKHIKNSGETYKTEIRVSVAVKNFDFVVETSGVASSSVDLIP